MLEDSRAQSLAAASYSNGLMNRTKRGAGIYLAVRTEPGPLYCCFWRSADPGII